MKITDIHSHTYYSFCGKDDPHDTVRAAIEGGIELFGISDHNYGIGDRFETYVKEMSALKSEYEDKIKILTGIEISLLPQYVNIATDRLKELDYCLVEVNSGENVPNGDFAALAKEFGIPTGIAHTDIFGMCERLGYDTEKYISSLAQSNVFWEMNVNYDSIHGYREHQYVKTFFASEKQQSIVKKAGLAISVGFDGHKVEDYLPERVRDACRRLEELDIRPVETLLV